jgi:hypothetical protein
MVKEDEIDLEMENCYNLAFNGNGRIAVMLETNSEFVLMEIGRNKTNFSQYIFTKKNLLWWWGE